MRKAGDVITELFREQFGPEFMASARASSDLFSSWPQVIAKVWPRSFDAEDPGAGPDDVPAAAVHSRIRELERGMLLVEADHPGWIQILQTKQAELLSAVQRGYPELDIRGIAFRLSRTPLDAP
jgi:predicted nucleic acid-binding Zn ribbon protein